MAVTAAANPAPPPPTTTTSTSFVESVFSFVFFAATSFWKFLTSLPESAIAAVTASKKPTDELVAPDTVSTFTELLATTSSVSFSIA